MISDTSYAELHDFAATVGIPPRAFERDHYDVIAERYEALVAAGAHRATSREIVAMLHRAGLRRRHRSVLAPPLGRVWPRPLVPGDLVAVVAPSLFLVNESGSELHPSIVPDSFPRCSP